MYKLDRSKLADRRICNWLAKLLYINLEKESGPRSRKAIGNAKVVPADVNDEPRFVSSREQSLSAQRLEAALVKRYLAWVARKGRTIEGAMRYPISFDGDERAGQPCCDLFDRRRNLIIEAKSKSDRHRIRMAIGQLADYAHLHRQCGHKPPRTAILLPSRPPKDLAVLLRSLTVGVISENGQTFQDIE